MTTELRADKLSSAPVFSKMLDSPLLHIYHIPIVTVVYVVLPIMPILAAMVIGPIYSNKSQR